MTPGITGSHSALFLQGGKRHKEVQKDGEGARPAKTPPPPINLMPTFLQGGKRHKEAQKGGEGARPAKPPPSVIS